MDKNEECGEDKVPETREERMKKRFYEKNRYISHYKFNVLHRNLFTKRLKNRGNFGIERISLSRPISDKFLPSDKLKDTTVYGPVDGKGSWKTDYCPSVIDTTAGEFCPAAAADKDKINKEKKVKTQKFEDKIRREKYTPGAKLDLTYTWNVYGTHCYGWKRKEKEKKIKQPALKQETEKTFEEKLCDTIGGLNRESTSDRAASFLALQAALCRRLVPDEVKNNYGIIAEALKKTLWKGHEAEQTTAAKLVPILCVQLGEGQCEPLLKLVKTPLLDIIADKNMNASVRAECCQSLAMVSFLSSSANGDNLKLMKTYERILSGTFQQDGSFNKCAKAESMLHVVALESWSLLLSKCSPAEVYALLGRATTTSSLSLSKLAQLLNAPSLELQKSAGIALSLVYELGSEFSEKFGQDELATITADVERLTKESSRFRAKEDRKIQRGIFRDVLKFFEDGVAPVERVCVGDQSMELDQWKLHVRYQRLAAGLGSGLQVSTRTSLLRSALLIRPLRSRDKKQKHQMEKPDQHTSESKAGDVLKAKKPPRNTSEKKAKNISRAKLRDKRSAVLHY